MGLLDRIFGRGPVAIDGRIVIERPPETFFQLATFFMPADRGAAPPNEFDLSAPGVVSAGPQLVWVDPEEGAPRWVEVSPQGFQDPGRIFSAKLAPGHWQVVVIATPLIGTAYSPDPAHRSEHRPLPRAFEVLPGQPRSLSLKISIPGAAPEPTSSRGLWDEFEDVLDRLRIAFPDSPQHGAVARRWVMRRPGYSQCPACAQTRAEAGGLPRRHEVKRVAGATSASETRELDALGAQPGIGNAEFGPWAARRRQIAESVLTDLEFRSADWSVEPQALNAWFRMVANRWICGGCLEALTLAFSPDASRLIPDRVFADLERALDGTPLLARVEAWRAESTAAQLAAATCQFCRNAATCFVLPWFTMCESCVRHAARR